MPRVKRNKALDKVFRDAVVRICPVCGKVFIPAVYHVYHTVGYDPKAVCSYSCMVKQEREHEANKKKTGPKPKKLVEQEE